MRADSTSEFKDTCIGRGTEQQWARREKNTYLYILAGFIPHFASLHGGVTQIIQVIKPFSNETHGDLGIPQFKKQHPYCLPSGNLT